MICLCRPSLADDDETLANRVKIGFIINFIQFTDWPEGTFRKADDPLVVAIFDNDPLEVSLSKAMEGKLLKGRKVVIRHEQNPVPSSRCHVLLVGTQGADRMKEIINGSGGAGVLSISDADGFIDAGGIIRLYIQDQKMRFEINVRAAEKSHLQISSKLLKLAKVVNN